MITPHLEKLILSGNASYNTFVIGGSEKSILNVAKNRFVVITDITYFHQLNLDEGSANILSVFDLNLFLQTSLNTQLRVFSRKSNNLFMFRNSVNFETVNARAVEDLEYIVTANGETHLNTYLIHEDDISFTFSKVGENERISVNISPPESIGNAPPFDYGLQGQFLPLPVAVKTRFIESLNLQNVPAGNKYKLLPPSFSYEFCNEVNNTTKLNNLENPSAYPIVLVGYVEVNGTPTNIGATL